MDPITPWFLFLGAALAADQAPQQQMTDLWETFEIVPWHFAKSWDWEPYTLTVLAPTFHAALLMEAQAQRDEGTDPDRLENRTYAVVRGGRQVQDLLLMPPDQPRPPLQPGMVVHFIWQAERSIEAETVIVDRLMDIHEAMHIAWSQIAEPSDVLTYSREVIDEEVFDPDMVVLGGEIVFVEEL